jgi:hypothetical protein
MAARSIRRNRGSLNRSAPGSSSGCHAVDQNTAYLLARNRRRSRIYRRRRWHELEASARMPTPKDSLIASTSGTPSTVWCTAIPSTASSSCSKPRTVRTGGGYPRRAFLTHGRVRADSRRAEPASSPWESRPRTSEPAPGPPECCARGIAVEAGKRSRPRS